MERESEVERERRVMKDTVESLRTEMEEFSTRDSGVYEIVAVGGTVTIGYGDALHLCSLKTWLESRGWDVRLDPLNETSLKIDVL